jgi:predicted negative regulator of RcsB-dependent stress response
MSSEVTESAGFYEFLAWLEINKKRIIVTTSVVAAVAVAVSFLVWRSKQKEIEASAALFHLGLPTQSSENSPPISASDYLKVAAGYQGTQASLIAELLGAGALYNENKYAEALDQFKKFQAAHSGSVLTAIAGLGVASSLESLGKFEEALQSYQLLVGAYPNEPISAQARVALGRLYENKKQPELAIKAYDEVIRNSQRSAWQSEASARKEQLLVQ